MTTTHPNLAPAPNAAGQAGTQTLVRGLRVLETLTTQDRPIGVGELARTLDLPKSTVQRLLRTLAQEGWAQTSNDAVTRWQISPRLISLARGDNLSRSLRDVAMPHLTALGASTGETVHFSVLDRDVQLVLIERVDSIHPVRTFNAIGATTALHTSCSGKAVLAMLPPAHVEEILARPLAKVMPNTIVDPQHLTHQILEARDRGYAVNISENRANVCAVGAAVADGSGRPVAAVAVSMPDIRFEPARAPEWGALVRDTARAITDALAH